MFTHFMNFVEPIRDRKKIAQIKNLLRGEKRFRDLLLFTVGINTALRISDLLQLRVDHFFDAQKRLRRRFWIREEKRGKRQEVVVNDSIREVLAEYLDAYPDVTVDPNHFIFFNTQTGGKEFLVVGWLLVDACWREALDSTTTRMGKCHFIFPIPSLLIFYSNLYFVPRWYCQNSDPGVKRQRRDDLHMT